MKKQAIYGDYTILIAVNSSMSAIYGGGSSPFLKETQECRSGLCISVDTPTFIIDTN